MSGQALKDLNTLPASERKAENSGKENFTKPHSENGNLEERNRKATASVVETVVSVDESVKTGVEVGNIEVEYIESENLNDVEDVDMTLKTFLAGLDSKDWISVCESLNDVRRLSIFHKEAMCNMLENVIPLVVKSLKNPRSGLCKTAIMTSADIFSAYGDHIIDSLDPLLLQLLLKSSQDKRFVCEAAERALIAMTAWVSPLLLLPKLETYLKHRNPRIRAKASMCFCRSVPRLGVEGIKEYGIDKLIQVAASQLSDQLPESREAARTLLLELQTVYEKCSVPTQTPVPEEEDSEMGSWEHFCQSKLSRLSAQAVLRVTNVAREGIALGS
ncbi:hypothetical protein Vadar_024816 [Vaccinium darrowii]|uniref:Uncharacterized protein n=1 Tax=Vaccinium darrowii TaxID=229202 RepID=A0ACB7Y1P0_9ERIC|nr:hypothetical protein Vadar_024816 [Vaccinium darrowii]